jgi:hypothetical protein
MRIINSRFHRWTHRVENSRLNVQPGIKNSPSWNKTSRLRLRTPWMENKTSARGMKCLQEGSKPREKRVKHCARDLILQGGL